MTSDSSDEYKTSSLNKLEPAGHYANLPGANALWHFAISVEESQSQLDDLQEVHVAPQELQKDKVIIIKTL